jgi:hypothetical protein
MVVWWAYSKVVGSAVRLVESMAALLVGWTVVVSDNVLVDMSAVQRVELKEFPWVDQLEGW